VHYSWPAGPLGAGWALSTHKLISIRLS